MLGEVLFLHIPTSKEISSLTASLRLDCGMLLLMVVHLQWLEIRSPYNPGASKRGRDEVPDQPCALPPLPLHALPVEFFCRFWILLFGLWGWCFTSSHFKFARDLCRLTPHRQATLTYPLCRCVPIISAEKAYHEQLNVSARAGFWGPQYTHYVGTEQ